MQTNGDRETASKMDYDPCVSQTNTFGGSKPPLYDDLSGIA